MKHVALATCLIGLLSWSGCGSSAEPDGSVFVEWDLGLESCGQLNISTVRVSLLDEAGGIADERTLNCTQYRHQFLGVPAGVYTLVIDGYRGQEDFPEWGAEALVDVRPGNIAEAEVTLDLKPGLIGLKWTLPDGMPCGFHGVSELAITYGRKGTSEAITEYYPCDPWAARIATETRDPRSQLYLDEQTASVMIPDLHAAEYRVRIQGIQFVSDTQEQVNLAGSAEGLVQNGRATLLTIPLQRCDGSASHPACGL